MKIGYVAFCDNKGGAARGAYRLHRGLLSHNHCSQFIVRRKFSNDSTVSEYRIPISHRKKMFNNWLTESIYPKLRSKYMEYQSFGLRYTGLDKYINSQHFDIVIMHWIGGDTISIKELANVKCPIIWRLADEWAFNGTLHYSVDNGWKSGYEKSSLLEDPNAFIWHRKLRFWSNKNIHFVCGSNWLSSRLSESKIFGASNVDTIPSSLETDIFEPKTSPQNALKHFSIQFNNQKKYIVFGAKNATKDPRKGFNLLIETLNRIQANNLKYEIELLVFGNEDPLEEIRCPCTVHLLGDITDDHILSQLYSLAQVVIVPSIVDNLPFVAIEALACGTPVIGFNIGGLPDIVTDNTIGTLVEPFDISALSEAIIEFVNRPKTIDVITACRSRAVKDYSVTMQVQRYITLAKELVEKKK
jgi:glycosyltransferase involved in cell wall biosynthesis